MPWPSVLATLVGQAVSPAKARLIVARPWLRKGNPVSGTFSVSPVVS